MITILRDRDLDKFAVRKRTIRGQEGNVVHAGLLKVRNEDKRTCSVAGIHKNSIRRHVQGVQDDGIQVRIRRMYSELQGVTLGDQLRTDGIQLWSEINVIDRYLHHFAVSRKAVRSNEGNAERSGLSIVRCEDKRSGSIA